MRRPDQYCDLAGFDDEQNRPFFYAHDSSIGTLIRVTGVRSIVGDDDYRLNVVNSFSGGIANMLKRPGHCITVGFESSYNIEEEVVRYIRPQYARATQKKLDVDAIIDENEQIIARKARNEKIFIVVWTRPDAAVGDDIKRQRRESREAIDSLPEMRNAQDPYLGLEALEGAHLSFVDRIVESMRASGLQAEVVEPNEDGSRPELTEIRRAILYHETPDNWSPYPAGSRRYPGVREKKKTNDASEFFQPTVASQIMTANAVSSGDLRTIEIGGRRFASVVMKMFPKTILPFNSFVNSLVGGGGGTDKMPFRIAFHIESMAGGDGAHTFKKIMAQLLAFMNSSNKNLSRNLNELHSTIQSDEDAVVKARVIAATWVEPGEGNEQLERRRSYLTKGLMTWGDAMVTDSPYDPMRAIVETVPGAVLRAKVPPASIAPISDLSLMMPFHRSAPVFKQGESIFLTMDGKMMPHEAFSPSQAFWLTVINATPGSGKSVLMNRLNFEFAAYYPSSTLPFLCVIDVGVSSSGFIELIKNALPYEQQHLAYYIRVKNTKEFSINSFDISLGSRAPIVRERMFIENFLLTLLGVDGKMVSQMVPRIIQRVFQIKSDLEMTSSPNTWQEGLEPKIDEACKNLDIKLHEKTRWWKIVDSLVEHKRFELALVAQRHAAPNLADVASAVSESIMEKDFGEELVRVVQRAIESAMNRYPIFSNVTNLDLGQARVVSIDLNDVIERGSSKESERNNTLMYMIARQVFLSKISGFSDEIPGMAFPDDLRGVYSDYWTKRFNDITDTPKRLCMDEYHFTGGSPMITAQVETDSREGRKWGLELILASQRIKDFGGLKDMASTVMLLNAESEEDRKQFQETYGFNDAVKAQLAKHVNGPQPGRGANFLVRYKLNDEERWVLLNNLIGPRLLWALTTRREDRAFRDELYSRVPVSDALTYLAKRYPKGTAHDVWLKIAGQQSSNEQRIPEVMVNSLMSEVLADAGTENDVHTRSLKKKKALSG